MDAETRQALVAKLDRIVEDLDVDLARASVESGQE